MSRGDFSGGSNNAVLSLVDGDDVWVRLYAKANHPEIQGNYTTFSGIRIVWYSLKYCFFFTLYIPQFYTYTRDSGSKGYVVLLSYYDKMNIKPFFGPLDDFIVFPKLLWSIQGHHTNTDLVIIIDEKDNKCKFRSRWLMIRKR